MDTYTVALTAATTIRLPPGGEIRLEQLPASSGEPVVVILSTDYVDTDFGVALPKQLRMSVTGQAGSIDEAEVVFAHVAAALTPIISFVANGCIPAPVTWLVYNSTPGVSDGEFVQFFHDAPTPLIPCDGRVVKVDLAQALVNVIQVWLNHPEAARIHRAMTQYQEAMGSWRPGEELRAVSHLWMGFEAATKAALRLHCARNGLTEDDACAAWGIERKILDPEVRRRLLFHEDDDCYKKTKHASDGLEHGYIDFPQLHAEASDVRDAAGSHLRRALIELVDAGADPTRVLTDPDLTPLDRTPFYRRVKARLRGDAVHLAAPGQSHPYLLEQAPEIVGVVENGERYDVTTTFRANPRIGAGLELALETLATTRPTKDLAVDINGEQLPTVRLYADDSDEEH